MLLSKISNISVRHLSSTLGPHYKGATKPAICPPAGRAEISSQSRTNRPLGSPDPRVSPTPIQAYKPTMATPPSVFPSTFTMGITGFLYVCLLGHIVTGINFPGLRVPLSGPRSSIYSLESCTDVSSSGAISNIHAWKYSVRGFQGPQALLQWCWLPGRVASSPHPATTVQQDMATRQSASGPSPQLLEQLSPSHALLLT